MAAATKTFWYMFHAFMMLAILVFVGMHFEETQWECEQNYQVDIDEGPFDGWSCIGEVTACNDDKYCGTPTSVLFVSSTWGTECWCRESKQIYDSTISFLVFGCLYWCYIALCGCFVCCDDEDTLDNPVMLGSHICANLILMICIIFIKPLGTSYGAFGLAFWILQIPLFCVTVYSDSFCLPDVEEKVYDMHGHRCVPLAAPTMTTIDLEFGNDTHMNNQNQLQSNHSQKNQENSPAPAELDTANPYQPNPPAYSQTGPTTTEGWGSNVQALPTNYVAQPDPADNRLTSSTMDPHTTPENIAEELTVLTQMRDNGILNDEELEAAKSKLLNQSSNDARL